MSPYSSITFYFCFSIDLLPYFSSNEITPGGDNSANPEQFDVVKETGCAGKTSVCICVCICICIAKVAGCAGKTPACIQKFCSCAGKTSVCI